MRCERRVAVACIAVDKHSYAGRCGLGAVMGSKKLKAVVAVGKMKVPQFDEAKTAALRKEYIPKLGGPLQLFRNFGTAGITAMSAKSGDSPVKNWAGVGERASFRRAVIFQTDLRRAFAALVRWLDFTHDLGLLSYGGAAALGLGAAIAGSWVPARDAARIAELRYGAGYSAFLEVLDAQRNANDAELALVRNRQQQLAYTVDFIRALGGGWTPES